MIMSNIKNYVEEVYIDHFVGSMIKEIKSINDYLLNNRLDSSLLGFRFFQIEQRDIDGEIFISEPKNFTEWISNNKYDMFDEVLVGNNKIKWSNCISLQNFILKLEETTKANVEKQYTMKLDK